MKRTPIWTPGPPTACARPSAVGAVRGRRRPRLRRWRLIALAGLLTLLGGVSTLQHRAARCSTPGEPTQVAVVQATHPPVTDIEVEALVRQAVALAGGLDHIIQPGNTVLVKPNLVWGAAPDEGHTTDPRVTRAVVQLAREAGAGQVLIADGAARYRDGHDARGATIEAFRLCGYDLNGDMTDDATGAPLLDLNNSGGLDEHNPSFVRRIQLQQGLIRTEYWLPHAILDADELIGVPVLKNHLHAGVTLALKNQFGIAPSDIYHHPGLQVYKGAFSHNANDLGRYIVDLNLARPLDFAVVDALRGLTDGPVGTTSLDPPMGLIMAGQDAVAVDTIGTLVMGYDPQTVPYLSWAAGADLGTDDVAQISVLGARVSQVRRDFPAPYGNTPAQRAEVTAPSVTLIAPSEGRTVLDNTVVWATATDDNAISKVEFYAGDELQAVVASPPYRAALDLRGHRAHTTTLRAIAYDAALNDAEDRRTVTVASPPAPGTASFQTTTLTLPTYPYAPYLTTVHTPTYNITYTVLDWSAYEDSHPTPIPHDYELLVMENEQIQVTLLPELGGRIYQIVFKPTGHNELYQNPVVKPTHWGPLEQGWWLAVGGIEWGLPVEEHGYEWGEPWAYQVLTSTAGVTVTLRDSTASDRIRAAVSVYLPSDRGILIVQPRIENPTGETANYKYWTNAMLAPGAANTVGADLHFVYNADQVTVHSRGDVELPEPGQPMDWPVHSGRDYSRLGNWNRWLGFFERPYATASFAAVYDTSADEGMARIFPPDVARGSKGFGFGWSDPIPASTWTDDDSAYVELHGGIAPTFWDTATITAGASLEWTEYWYPVSGIGQLSAATAEAALGVRESDGRFIIGAHTTRSRANGESVLYVWDRHTCAELAHWELPAVGPEEPYGASVQTGGRATEDVAFVYLSKADVDHAPDGNVLAALNPQDCLPPTSTVSPLPFWVATTAFPVTWTGQDTWSDVAAYDVQVRDGYDGEWTAWLSATSATSGTYTGTHGHTYFFRTRARDTHGNQASYTDEEWGQAFTTVLTEAAPVLASSRKSASPDRFSPGQIVTYTVHISNTGNLTASAVMTDTLPPTMVALTETLVNVPEIVLLYPEQAIRWVGVLTPASEIRVSYALSPTAATPFGVALTNTVEIAGSVLGTLTRQATVVQARPLWLPLVIRAN